MASSSPCTMRTLAPEHRSASSVAAASVDMSSGASHVAGDSFRIAAATFADSAAHTSFTPAVAAARTTRTMPSSHPLTHDGLR